MCKPDKSLNTGVQTSYLSSHERGFEKNQPCRRGSAPYRRSDWTSRMWAMSKLGQLKTTRERRALSLFFWRSDSLEHLWNSAKLRPPTRAGPLDSHLENQPFMKSKTVPKPQNHGATNSTTAEQRAFPVTSRSRGFSEGARTDHVKPETKNWTHAGKRNQRIQPALNQQKASNKPTFLILTKPLKFDLNAVTKQRFVRDLFPG